MMHNFSDHTIESLLQRNTARSQIIYITVLLVIIAAGIIAYFVKAPVTVQGQGIVRPLTERTEIKAVVSEKLTALYISEGQIVQKGDTILCLNAEKIHIVIEQTKTEIAKQKIYIADLQCLLNGSDASRLQSTYYRAQKSSYQRKLQERRNRLNTITKNYERSKNLFESEVIAPAEMEKDEQDYLSAVSEVEMLKAEQEAHFEDDLNRYNTSLNELESQLMQYNKELLNYTLLAPVSGTVEQFSGIYAGNYVMSGSTIAVISPNASFQIECYVQPKDIGFIRMDSDVRVQVGAFPYTEWGMLNAKTVSISDDYVTINNTPMFRVRCTPETDYLSLKNGFQGKIKKGMTVQVRFPVVERTLYQLLFDNVNDWLNPAQQSMNIFEPER
ncbi:MAG: HlyD family efflux transporter periplasmic adaptor subunit [Prevotellaceae bacterium]|jgi:HlyD family secretion protein|nr:HlyD family efflux transporter periplasmic adaptor subunit [Prevotellaceae bacterium]